MNIYKMLIQDFKDNCSELKDHLYHLELDYEYSRRLGLCTSDRAIKDFTNQWIYERMIEREDGGRCALHKLSYSAIVFEMLKLVIKLAIQCW